MQSRPRGVRVGVDVGGTFTDAVVVGPDGLATAKVPTTAPQSAGVLHAIDRVLDRAGLAPSAVDALGHASTVATNALIERDGARTDLVTTEGFRDVLEIGRQDRPSLYDLEVERPPPLVPRRRRHELAERTPPPDREAPRRRPDPGAIAALAEDLADSEAVAVALLHAYHDDDHERTVAERLAAHLDVPVVRSSAVLPTVREYERTATTVASAYLTPVMRTYLEAVIEGCRERGLPTPQVMQSNGGLTEVSTVLDRAVTAALSGPAAGVVGARRYAVAHADLDPGAITLDMGGTSADIAIVDDAGIEHTDETVIAGVPVRTPVVDVTTVGAGGGSIAWIDDGGALRVGPESAGAAPGPACYGRGGDRPTVTDAAVLLGYLEDGATLGGSIDVDADAARSVVADLAEVGGLDDAEATAVGIIRVAEATMARAIRTVTVEAGRDPRTHALVAFGGAGGMLAAGLADSLGIERVVLPDAGGVLSAEGLVHADERHDAVQHHRGRLDQDAAAGLEAALEEVADRARRRCTRPDAATVDAAVDLRYVGQSYELTVAAPASDPPTLVDRFHAHHRRVRGYRLDDPVETVAVRATATVATPGQSPPARDPGNDAAGRRSVRVPGHDRTAFVRYPGPPGSGATLDVPCIIERSQSTVVVPPGWSGAVAADGTVVVDREARS
ncbi:MAG: hydantoinase/oxoprolinase family protein [Halobacteriales archaeon]